MFQKTMHTRKKTVQRTLCFLLTLIMLVGLLPIGAFAAAGEGAEPIVPFAPYHSGVINGTNLSGNAEWTFDPTTNTVTIHGGPGIWANQQGRGSHSPWSGPRNVNDTGPAWDVRADISADIHRIVFDGPVQGGTLLQGLFNGLPNLTEIVDLDYLNTGPCAGFSPRVAANGVSTIQHIFRNTPSLTNLDVSHFDTSFVSNFNGTFQNTGAATILGLEEWDVSSATNVSQMFFGARNLEWIDTTDWSWDALVGVAATSGFNQMFEQTDSLREIIGIETWDVSQVRSFNSMFRDALSIENLDLSAWDVGNVWTMANAFNGARSLQSVDTTGWDTENVTHMNGMFANWNGATALPNIVHTLTSIPGIEGWNTENVTHMNGMFDNAFALQALDLSAWDTGSVQHMDNMFRRTHALTSLDLSDWDVSNVVNMSGMFDMANPDGRISQLTSIGDVRDWETGNVTQMQNMFRNTVFTQLNLSGWDTSRVSNMQEMFRDARDLWRLNLRDWDTSSIASPGWMTGMFMDTLALRQITLGEGWHVGPMGGNTTLLPDVPDYGYWRNVDRTNGGTAWTPDSLAANALPGTPAEPEGDHMFTSDELMDNPEFIADTWVWEPRPHFDITFEFDGGTYALGVVPGDPAGPITLSLPEDMPVGADHVPSPVTRVSHVFNGWRYDGQAEGTPNLTDFDVARWVVRGPQTFTAQWVQRPHTVIFDLNGGNVADSTVNWVHTIAHNGQINVYHIPTPNRFPTHSLLGWRYDGQADGTPYLQLADLVDWVVTRDITFTAHWITPPIGIYEVVFDLDGGNVNGNTDDISHYVPVNTPVTAARVPDPVVRENHIFSGWRYNGQADDTPNLTCLQVARKIVLGNHIFTAQWEAIPVDNTFTLTYVAGDHGIGGPHVVTGVREGNRILISLSITDIVAEEGYRFIGWIVEGETELRRPGTPIAVDRDLTIIAQWERVGEELLPERQAFMIGRPDGLIHPHDSVERAEIATIFFRMISDELRTEYWVQDNPYDDVPLEAWFNNAVSTMHNFGLFEGIGNNMFAPRQELTRGELAVLLVRFMERNEFGLFSVASDEDQFNDILGHWARDYINRAAIAGWLSGPEGIGGPFNPSETTTRAEVAAIISRIFRRLVECPAGLLPNMITWPDNANEGAWYYLYMQSATNSYTYEWNACGMFKTWRTIIEPRDWSVLESPDSTPWCILD